MEKWTYSVLDRFWERMHRWHRKTLHDKILIAITVLAVFAVALSICLIDSYNWLWAFGTVIVGCTWILLFAYANERD